jgi:26S proteasome regulatory subunit N5
MAEDMNPVLGNLAKDPKATEDYAKETEELIARVDTMCKAGRVDEAVEEMLALEKKTRTASDGISTAKLLSKIVQVYWDKKDWPKLHEHIVLLSKKRGQLKRAITDMVHLAMSWLETLDKEKKLELIATLNEVTEGKIFVEVEKAKLTQMQAEIKEAEGNVEEAANLLQEVQVEAFGAMERREKTEYILNQMRLVLLKKDFVRTQIISRKINPKLLEADDFQDLKIRYNEYMIKYWLHEKKMMEVAKCYLAIYNTASTKTDEAKWKEALTAYTIYLTLAQYDNEQEDMLNKLDALEAKKLDKVPAFKQIIKIFLRKEIAAWPVENEGDIKAHAAFQDSPHEGAAERWTLFRKRIVQHNIKVVTEYYEQIHMKRLCELIGLTEKEAEAELSELVCSKFIFAKMDRPAGTIKFGQKQTYTDRLNDWSGSISKMLDLVENSCHLIQKEQMVHAARAKLKPKK